MKEKQENTGREVRSMPVRELRADDESRTITGYAAVFNSDADLGFFTERINPGAFKRAINEDQDVRALWNHDPNFILGRTKSGTLRLSEDKKGLRIEIDPPDTQVGRDMVESIRRGDVDQMSFAFQAVKESWTERKGDLPLRELDDVDLYDVSPVTYPAYEATSVGLRSAEDIYNEHIQSTDAQECAGDDDDVDTDAQVRDRDRHRLSVFKLNLKGDDHE